MKKVNVLISTMTAGGLANIHVGNLHIIPYLTQSRNKLFFVHSRFHARSLEHSSALSIRTALDNIIDTFDAKELASSSSFVIQRQEDIFIGVLDREKNRYEVFKFANSQ